MSISLWRHLYASLDANVIFSCLKRATCGEVAYNIAAILFDSVSVPSTVQILERQDNVLSTNLFVLSGHVSPSLSLTLLAYVSYGLSMYVA